MRFTRLPRKALVLLLLAQAIGALPLTGCGTSAPETTTGPTAQDEKVREQMLEYDKANGLSKKAR